MNGFTASFSASVKSIGDSRYVLTASSPYYGDGSDGDVTISGDTTINDTVWHRMLYSFNDAPDTWYLSDEVIREDSQRVYLLRKSIEYLKFDFNLQKNDLMIPKKCPVLGIEIFVSQNYASDNSPTIDRINNSDKINIADTLFLFILFLGIISLKIFSYFIIWVSHEIFINQLVIKYLKINYGKG